jgi:hypothetical protein
MPGLDKTGPEGKGSRTGRGLGICGDQSSDSTKLQEQQNPSFIRNYRKRMHMGRKGAGKGNRFRFRRGQEK